MALVVNTNTASLGAQRNLQRTGRALDKNVRRLSSGLRIANASDDAAGLGISERLKAQIRGMSQASRNANDGISMIQVAEGAMNEQAEIMTRLRELAVQSANGTLGDSERAFIDAEADELLGELDRIATVTEYNGVAMLATGAAADVQVGINAGETISIQFGQTDGATLGTSGGGAALNTIDLSNQAGADAALDILDASIDDLSSARATVGAAQNRLEITVNTLASAHENLSAANSRIRDVDVAEETASLTRNQILSQAGVAVLAQANQLPSAALSLLG
jgi:flagellin